MALLLWSGLGSADETHLLGELRTGDVIGVSIRRGVVGFIVQAATESPISHVAIVSVEDGIPYVYHWPNSKDGVKKITLAELVTRYRTEEGIFRFAHARPKGRLSAKQQKQLTETLDIFAFHPERISELSTTISSDIKGCAHFGRAVFETIGMDVGKITDLKDLKTEAFNNLVGDVWRDFTPNQETLIPPKTLLEGNMQLITHNLETSPSHWSLEEMVDVWRNKGDLRAIARLHAQHYGGDTNLPASKKVEGFVEFLDSQIKNHEIPSVRSGVGGAACLKNSLRNALPPG